MLERIFNSLCSLVPKRYSMKEETNIVGIYNEYYLLSEKSNLVGALKLEGISYLSLDDKEIAQKFNERILALNEIVDGVHFKIVAKRRKIFMHHEYTQEEISNPFALEVINLWEQGVDDVYQNFYYLIFETKNDSIKGYLERFKKKITTNELENIQENNKQDEVKYQENYFIGFDNFNLLDKSKILDSIINNVKNMLSGLFVEKIDANSLLNFYAEYINGVPSEYTFARGRLHDINSDEVIVIVTGAKATPLKLKANYWFKDKELLKRANLPIDLEVERKRVEEPTQPTTEITTPPNQNKQDTANLEPSNNGEYTENESSESNNENNPTTPQKESENSNPTESEKDHENPTTSQEKSKNENTEQENDETDEILKKPLNEMNTEEKRALFKKMQQGDEESEQEVLQDTQS